MKQKISISVFFLLLLPFIPAMAQQQAHFVTFSQQASTVEGDDDFRQSIYIAIPKKQSAPLWLEIFDPDVGGSYDEEHGNFNSQTRFSLLGLNKKSRFALLQQGKSVFKVVSSKIFSSDQGSDSRWVRVFPLKLAESANYEGDFALFRLDVAGLAGDDGNTFDIRVVAENQMGNAVDGVTIFSFKPTLYIPVMPQHYTELRFATGANNRKVFLSHFDLDGAELWYDTLYSSKKIHYKPGNSWQTELVQTQNNSASLVSSIRIGSLKYARNAITLAIRDQNKKLLPLLSPFSIRLQNYRPVNKVQSSYLGSCQRILFDASASYDPDGDKLNYSWSFGDGETATGMQVTHDYKKTGVYQVELTTHDQSNTVASGKRTRFFQRLNQQPVAAFKLYGSRAPDKILIFDATSSYDPDGMVQQYIWDFGDGQQAVGKKVKHKYFSPGIYKVRLTVRDASNSPCSQAVLEKQVKINAAPVVDVGNDKVAAVNELLDFSPVSVFDADSTKLFYQWDFGDGSRKTGKQVQHRFNKAGKYRVTLTVNDDSGSQNAQGSDSLMVHVNAPPVANAGKNQKASVLQLVKFNASRSYDPDGQIIEYLWDFGDNSQAYGKNAIHAYQKPGNYQVTLTVKDNAYALNSSSQAKLWIKVNSEPVARAKYDYQQNSAIVRFDAKSSIDKDGRIVSWYWDFGDGKTSRKANPVHAYGNPGVYRVKLRVQDDSGTSNNFSYYYFTVKINSVPIADAGGDRVVAPGTDVTFVGSASKDQDGKISQYLWTFPDGTQKTGVQVSYRFDKQGDYDVTLQVSDQDNPPQKALDSIKVHVNTAPNIHLPEKIITAPGERVWFDASNAKDADGKVTQHIWRFSDQNRSYSQAKLARTFNKAGVYYAWLTLIDNAGVENSIVTKKLTIEVNSQPVAKAGNDILSCEATVHFDGSQSLDADQDTLTYWWDFGDGSAKKQGMQVQHTYQKPGKYPVVLTVNDGRLQRNSEARDALVVQINEPPVADAGLDQVVCAGSNIAFDGSASFDAKGGLLKYLWHFGDGTTGHGINPSKTYSKGGIYPVQLQVEDTTGLVCGKDQDQAIIKVVESPVAKAGKAIQACANSPVRFDGSQSTDSDGLVNSFFWDFGDGATGGGATPEHAYSKPGTYTAKLTITGDQIEQCDSTDSDTVEVTILSAPVAKFAAPDHVALNEAVFFDASASSAGKQKIIQWLWDFGDGSQAEGQTVTHEYKQPGKYHVRLRVKSNADSQCNLTEAKSIVVVNAAPVANAGEDKTVKINDIVNFDASASKDPDGAISRYFWDFGDGTTQSGIKVDHQYAKPGKYRVKLQVTDDSNQRNNESEDTITVTVTQPNHVYINANRSLVCPGDQVNMALLGYNKKQLNWLLNGNLLKQNAQKISHVFSQSGKYQISVQDADSKKLLGSKTIIVNQPPRIKVSQPKNLCVNEKGRLLAIPEKLFANNGISKYLWTINGKQYKGSTLGVTFAKNGTYSWSLKAFDRSGLQCGIAEEKGEIRINNPPYADAGKDRVVYIGSANDAVVLDGGNSKDPDGDTLSYRWIFSDGTIKYGKKVSYTWQKPGRYRVRLIVSDQKQSSCSTDEDQIMVIVKSYEE